MDEDLCESEPVGADMPGDLDDDDHDVGCNHLAESEPIGVDLHQIGTPKTPVDSAFHRLARKAAELWESVTVHGF